MVICPVINFFRPMLTQNRSTVKPYVIRQTFCNLIQVIIPTARFSKRGQFIQQNIYCIWHNQNRHMPFAKLCFILLHKVSKCCDIALRYLCCKCACMFFDQIVILCKINILALPFSKQPFHRSFKRDPSVSKNKLICQVFFIIGLKITVKYLTYFHFRHPSQNTVFCF